MCIFLFQRPRRGYQEHIYYGGVTPYVILIYTPLLLSSLGTMSASPCTRDGKTIFYSPAADQKKTKQRTANQTRPLRAKAEMMLFTGDSGGRTSEHLFSKILVFPAAALFRRLMLCDVAPSPAPREGNTAASVIFTPNVGQGSGKFITLCCLYRPHSQISTRRSTTCLHAWSIDNSAAAA